MSAADELLEQITTLGQRVENVEHELKTTKEKMFLLAGARPSEYYAMLYKLEGLRLAKTELLEQLHILQRKHQNHTSE